MGLTLCQTQHVQSGSFLDQTGQKQLAAGGNSTPTTCFWTASPLSFVFLIHLFNNKAIYFYTC